MFAVSSSSTANIRDQRKNKYHFILFVWWLSIDLCDTPFVHKPHIKKKWISFYFLGSGNKSYRCVYLADRKIQLYVIMSLRYKCPCLFQWPVNQISRKNDFRFIFYYRGLLIFANNKAWALCPHILISKRFSWWKRCSVFGRSKVP
jgi:hypothetical protein